MTQPELCFDRMTPNAVESVAVRRGARVEAGAASITQPDVPGQRAAVGGGRQVSTRLPRSPTYVQA